MKLIGAIASPYVTRVVMFARIKGVDLPLEAPPGGSPRSDEYQAMTPIAKIPSLVVDGRVLAESEIICEYLEDAYPEKSGFPENNLDKATSRLISPNTSDTSNTLWAAGPFVSATSRRWATVRSHPT